MIKKFDIGIILVSLILYVALANAPFKAKPFGDLDFHIETKTIARFLWAKEDYNSVSITKAPGPVLFYIIPYFIVGPDASNDTLWFAGIIWTGLFMTLSVLLIKKSCENFGSERAGKLAVILLFLLPLHIYYSLGILAEGLAFFGCCLQIFAYSRIYKGSDSPSSWFLLSLGLLLMILARPNAILVLPLLLLVFFWMVFIKKNQAFQRVRNFFLISWASVVVFLIMISAAIRQLPNTRKTVKQKEYLGFVATIGRYQFREETWDWRFWDSDVRPDSKDYINWQHKVNELEATGNGYMDFVTHDIFAHPLISIKQFLVRSLFGHTLQVSSVKKQHFGVGPVRGTWVYWTFHVILNIFNFCLILAAISFLMKKNLSGLIKIIAIPWIALVLFHGIIYLEQRYLFPIRPVIIVLSALFITSRFFQTNHKDSVKELDL